MFLEYCFALKRPVTQFDKAWRGPLEGCIGPSLLVWLNSTGGQLWPLLTGRLPPLLIGGEKVRRLASVCEAITRQDPGLCCGPELYGQPCPWSLPTRNHCPTVIPSVSVTTDFLPYPPNSIQGRVITVPDTKSTRGRFIYVIFFMKE